MLIEKKNCILSIENVSKRPGNITSALSPCRLCCWPPWPGGKGEADQACHSLCFAQGHGHRFQSRPRGSAGPPAASSSRSTNSTSPSRDTKLLSRLASFSQAGRGWTTLGLWAAEPEYHCDAKSPRVQVILRGHT